MKKQSCLFWTFSTLVVLLLAACVAQSQRGGFAWGVGAFDSNGERIYFSATSERGANITYSGGPSSGMMMGGGYLTCASCHGPNGRGGVHTMMGMQTMNAPDIRWSVLAGGTEGEHGGETEEGEHGETGDGYDLEPFRLAVVEGKHPGGKSLSSNMPRWNISDEDLSDLADYLKALP
jgi:mono/diheme cytochrome c family protein